MSAGVHTRNYEKGRSADHKVGLGALARAWLNSIPTLTPDGNIRLQVAPDVSSLDFVDGLTIQGFTVPL